MVFAVNLNNNSLEKLSSICKENANAEDNKEYFILSKEEMDEAELNKKIAKKIKCVSQQVIWTFFQGRQIMKIKNKLRKFVPIVPKIETEGIWYNRAEKKYEAHYYPSKLEKIKIIGLFDTLDEAILARQVYYQAMEDVKEEIKIRMEEK